MTNEGGQAQAERLLLDHLETLERIIAFTCRRNGLDGADAEDFAGAVKLRLIENEYAIVRKFEGRSSFPSFLNVVVQRMLFDERNHRWGKWHSSAEAKRLGDVAIELEKLIRRDGRTLDEALTVIRRARPEVTRGHLVQLESRLPSRAPRRRTVELDEVQSLTLAANSDTEAGAFTDDRVRTSERVSAVMKQLLDALPEDDQLILQLRFEQGMTVAQIARALQIEQKLLYRRIDRQMRDLREELIRAGIDADTARDLFEHRLGVDFCIGNPAIRPSSTGDEQQARGRKEIAG